MKEIYRCFLHLFVEELGCKAPNFSAEMEFEQPF